MHHNVKEYQFQMALKSVAARVFYLFIDKLTYVTFDVFTSLCYNGISQ